MKNFHRLKLVTEAVTGGILINGFG